METQDIQPRADLASDASVEQAQNLSLLEQARVKHIFTEGAYVKAYSVPAGVKLYTKQFKNDHVTILAKGSVYIKGPDYEAKISSPIHVPIKADARYLVVTLEECVWYCIHVTDETDPERIMETF